MLIFFFLLPINPVSVLCTSTNDTYTLTKFRQSADIHDNLALNWSTSNACSWTGVLCSSITGRVISLSLPNFDLHGPLDVLSGLDHLRFLRLHGNSLNGTLFSIISSLSHLKIISLYRNDISGSIPPQLGLLNHLVHVDISYNRLEGPIVSGAFLNLAHLLTFRAQNNRLSGQVPDLTVVLPKLSKFNVSYNMLNGSVPHAMIMKFGKTSFLGNKNSSSKPQPVNPCIPTINCSSSCNTDEKWPPHIILILVGNAAFIFVLMLLLVSFCLCFVCKIWKKGKIHACQTEVGKETSKQTGDEDNEREGGDNYEEKGEVMVQSKLVFFQEPNYYGNNITARDVFGVEELLCASTEVIGKGSVGVVYKAVLENGSTIAVKRLKSSNTFNHDEFRGCVSVMGKVTHSNVLPLMAYYCYAPQGRVLIYNYLPKGSLRSLLHGNQGGRRRAKLDWARRIKVIVESARGLACIHRYYGSHGNIRSSNILIGYNGTACISDFGHALLVDPERVVSKLGGYIAPEQKECIKRKMKEDVFSEEADVYAFGVVILEVITGNKPILYPSRYTRHTSRYRSPISLPEWVEFVVKEEWSSEVFDPELLGNNNDEDEMLHILRIAMKCVDYRAQNRPRIVDVVRWIEDYIVIEEHLC